LLPVHILIVRITLGNYRVEPQSREARLWLVFENFCCCITGQWCRLPRPAEVDAWKAHAAIKH